MSRFYEKMERINIAKSNEEHLIDELATDMGYLLDEFNEELELLEKLDPNFVTSHGHKRSLMYLLTAKLAYNNNKLRLSEGVYKSIIEWGTVNYDSLQKLVLRNKEFKLKIYRSY